MIEKSTEISVFTTSEGAEIIADMLSSFTGEGVSIYDGKDVLEVLSSKTNWDYVEDGVVREDDTVIVKGYISDNVSEILGQINTAISDLKADSFGIDFGELRVETKEVRTDNWNEEWRKFYKPIVLDKVAVVPEWIDFESDTHKIIRMEPGMAFGTGEHASTRLCLSLLEKLDMEGKRVIDVGTGSGILGIASAMLGAKSVYMTDIDQKAVEVAIENTIKNKVEKACSVECADLSDRIECDILIGNLTADILLRLLDKIAGRIKSGATLVLSGIIESRLSEVLDAYQSKGFNLLEVLSEGDWRAIKLKV